MIGRFFDAGSPRCRQRGFGVAPVLYLLGLIGVAGGVLFSNYMQAVKIGFGIQNGLTVRNDLMAASMSLATQGVFSTNNMQFCPPRSEHQSAGKPCADAPVGLIQFQDFPNAKLLPVDYGSAIMTGSPVEVGIFAVGAIKQIDAFGHAYIYCRWENGRNNPAAPAFVIISAGSDGVLQTACGDNVAQGDDSMISFPVAEAITHASLWQTQGATNVSYGATGTQVTIDGNGDLTAAGSVTGNAGNFGTLAVTGPSSLAGPATLGSDLTVSGMANLQGGASVAGGALLAGVAYLGKTSASSLSVSGASGLTGAVTLGSTLAVTGTLSGYNAVFTGSLQANGLNDTGMLLVTGTATFLNGIAVSGGATISDGALTSGTASLGATAVASLVDTGTASISGLLSGASAIFTGSVTAASFIGGVNLGSTGNTGIVSIANGGTGSTSASTALANLGITSGGVLNTALLTAGLIEGNDLVAHSVTSAQLNATGVGAGTCYVPIVGSDGRVTACGSTDTGALSVNGATLLNGALNVAGAAIFNNLVGIGTNNPQALLDIYQPSGSYAYVRDGLSGMKLIAAGGANYIESAGAGMAGTAALSFTDMNAAHTWMMIGSTGNVGIGTTNPQSVLHVATGEVQVSSSGNGCASTNAGAIRYSSGTMSYCNGSAWLPFKGGTSAPIGSGYFVLSAGLFNGCGGTTGSITHSGNVATWTTASPHDLTSGTVITVIGTSDSLYSGTFSVTVTGTKTFTYTMSGTPAANNSTSPTYCVGAGGLAAYNQLCLNELTSLTGWWDHANAAARGLLTSVHVMAWLCTSSACQDLHPNTTYYFANVSDPSAGGASFITDGNGYGTGDQAQWALGSYFGGVQSAYSLGGYWTGRAAGTSQKWGGPSGSTCNNWTDDTGNYSGEKGNTIYNWGYPIAAGGSTRWASSSANCGNTADGGAYFYEIICAVNP